MAERTTCPICSAETDLNTLREQKEFVPPSGGADAAGETHITTTYGIHCAACGHQCEQNATRRVSGRI